MNKGYLGSILSQKDSVQFIGKSTFVAIVAASIFLSGFFVWNYASAFVVVTPNTWSVDISLPDNSGCNTTTLQCQTIQAAIDGASSGDTINVVAGTYPETLNLGGKTLTIEGAGADITTIDASSFTGYAIQNFGDGSIIRGLTLIGTGNSGSSYGFKISHVSNITLENIKVENSYKTGIDLNTVTGAILNNIEVNNTTSGFGLMILDSTNVAVANITTSGNAWGGVSVQAKNAVTDSITFSGLFSASESNPLLLEKDPPAYPEITNVQISSQFQYVVYGLRTADNYKQWFYQETLSNAKVLAGTLVGSYSGLIAYDVVGENYYVENGMKIQDAINAASSGDTINVAAGTYTTTGQIVIDKNLTIIGTGGKPVIQPDADLPQTNAVAGAWFLVNPGVTFNLNNFVLDGNGLKVQQAIRSHGATIIDNVDFLNVRNSTSPYVGFAIASFGGTILRGAGSDTHNSGGAPSSLTVTGSTFAQIGRIGILIKGPDSTATISGNTYTGKGDGNFLDYAFEIGAGGSATIENNIISGNRGVATSDGSTSAGILVTDYYGTGTEATITGNTISDNTDGIAAGYSDTDDSIVVAHSNKFSGNAYAINSTHPAVDATNNWWGDASGPTHSTNPAGTGDAVSDNVSFNPWYTNAERTSLAGQTTLSPEGNNELNLSTPVEITTADLEVEIPADTTVTGPAGWDGTIGAPTVQTVASVAPSVLGYSTVVDTIVEIGFPDIKLTFDNAVRILLPGKAGKKVGYARTGEPFHEITSVCADDTQVTNNLLPDEGDCKISVGSDLAVWTKHFTQFITYTLTTLPPNGFNYTTPAGTAVVINSGDATTNNTAVNLALNAFDVGQMKISNLPDFSDVADWEPYATTKSWTLTDGDGTKTVYAKYRTFAGDVTDLVSDSIILQTTPPTGGQGQVLGAAASTPDAITNQILLLQAQLITLLQQLLQILQSQVH